MTLLFLPGEGYRDALLRDGIGGASMPIVCLCSACHSDRRAPADPDDDESCPKCEGCGGLFNGWGVHHVGALVLILRGTVAVEGCDRLARVAIDAGLVWTMLAFPSLEQAEALAMGAEAMGLGTVVRLGEL